MDVRKPFLSALAACFSLALLFAAGCATPSTPGGTTCGTGQTACNGQCVNLMGSDPQNCGACGKTCGAGSSCQSGACVCGSGQISCASGCVASDINNCGSCGKTCTGTQVCSNGQCASDCMSDETKCSAGKCAKLASDAANCGSCGNACPSGATCSNSTCVCTAPLMLCGATCVDTNTSNAHCGGCNRACNGTCTNGSCSVTSGMGGTTGAGGSTGGSTAGTTGSGGTGGSTAGTTGTGGRGGTTGAGGSTAGTTGAGGNRTCAIMPPPGAIADDVISDFEEGYGVMIKQGGRTGYWSPYNNTADPQNQTPAKPAAAMADKILAEPTGVCMNSGFHSSATGQDNYVGFGAKFHPNMPLTSSELGDAYDVSKWDGITFRAKTGGSPTSQPVFVEILTKETQPSTAGGTATVQAVDLYNNRGYMVTIGSTSYQQFFVPFGGLIPRSLPAAGSGGNACPAGSNPKCQAPKFVAANALALQFSWYGPNDTPGFLTPNPVGSYNVIIDDVAFYKRSALPSGMSDMPALPNSGGAHPLAENGSLNARCARPAGANGKLLGLAYDNWKKRFVRAGSPGQKVIRPENGDDTVSEGIAYGMMIAVYFDDKPLFDGLFQYWNAHVATNGLMTWCIPAGANSCSASGGTATDADEDAAFAMLMASKQWPTGGYASQATTLINAVMSTDLSGNYIKAGSNYQASSITNPSYFAPAFYRVFGWTGPADNSYTLLNAALQGRTNGLVAAWCTGGSCNAPASNGGADDMRYQYDSHRIPWRILLDYCWNNNSNAQAYLNKVVGFFAGKAANGTGRVFDIYDLNGMETSNAAVNSSSAIGTAAAGAMGTTQTAFLNDGFQLVLDLLNRGEIGDRLATSMNVKSGYSYFNATVGLLMLLTMTGNFVAW
ncbi:MAG TPA: glycosyl hydrolase family 8 [Polyangia bacterium]